MKNLYIIYNTSHTYFIMAVVMVLLVCCFISSCLSPLHSGNIKDSFCRGILSPLDSNLGKSFRDQVLTTTESVGGIAKAVFVCLFQTPNHFY